ncbi:MAG: efflux RND transporter permease subunit [Candidatus Riflebacteria bacterium]|nr:efflux RND transporter permease subunit [Candidatus Riflebacteria bacterium]
MLSHLIRIALEGRLVVLFLSVALLVGGGLVAVGLPVDVLPDLTAPTVTILTEAHGLAPEEVETLVTFPIESALNGAGGVRRVRSSSGIGISVVWVEFDWDTDIFIARQVVSEKLQMVAPSLPPDVGRPLLAPISSVMGEILFLGLSSETVDPVELRTTADWLVRRRLLAVSGVSQVIPIDDVIYLREPSGAFRPQMPIPFEVLFLEVGGVRQYQVLVAPAKLAAFGVSFDEVAGALRQSNANSSGGFLLAAGQEYLIRGMGRVTCLDDLAETVVAERDGVPVKVGHVAVVTLGAAPRMGVGSVDGRPAVVLGVLKQPGTNTLEVTRRIDAVLQELQGLLPADVELHRNLLRQADFIEKAVTNVEKALRDGAVLVVLILLAFLASSRATLISVSAIPLSLLVAILAFRLAGVTISTMTLGGQTIAIGALVDDAIIDVENVLRRLRENRCRPPERRHSILEVIWRASNEIRPSMVLATFIIILVFLPLFFLSGVEGRLLAPLGFSYITALFASLIVSLTLTPVLCYYLLGRSAELERGRDGPVLRLLQALYGPLLALALRRPWLVMLPAVAALAAAVATLPQLGRAFLPEFNEGALTLSAMTLPGTNLIESDKLGRLVEERLRSVPEVKSTARRTGRAELDEHAMGSNGAEIDVRLELGSRSKQAILADVRSALRGLPGLIVNVGQPISHRIDHLLSGTRSAIAVKLFGTELPEMMAAANAVRDQMARVRGVVDLSVEQASDIPELRLEFDRRAVARYGLRVGQLAEAVEGAFAGHVVGQVLEQGRTHDLVVRYEDAAKADLAAISKTLFDTPAGAKVPLEVLARIERRAGPNTVNRENVQRKVVVSCNVQDRDLGGVIADIRQAVEANVRLPAGTWVAYGGQFESEQEARRTIGMLSLAAIAGIFVLLFLALGSVRLAAITMANLPLAFIGGLAAVVLSGGVLNVASLVGFITLFGIATRNGVLMITHYQHLLSEGKTRQEAVLTGSRERLAPVVMTALTAGLALVPLIVAGGEPGNELQAPMAVVILGGLVTSTALNMFVVPILFDRYGKGTHGRDRRDPARGERRSGEDRRRAAT